MHALDDVAPDFLAMTRNIITCTCATVDARGRSRSRMMQPIWLWQDGALVGWVAVLDTPVKREHLAASPYMSCSYWLPNQDTCVAECRVQWAEDDAAKQGVWDLFAETPAPVGYNPQVIAGWEDIRSPTFGGLKLEPWRLRLMPGSVMTQGKGEVLSWERAD